jgi:ATP-dependent Clp protease ATP-binding subunit ClpB
VVLEEVRKSFRPEFLNRLDDLIVFRRLAREQMEQIVDIQLELFRKRLERRGLAVNISPQAKAFLVEQGWDPQYGARPLKRAIQRFIEDELAKRILGGEFKQGDTIAIGREGDTLTFSRMAPN